MNTEDRNRQIRRQDSDIRQRMPSQRSQRPTQERETAPSYHSPQNAAPGRRGRSQEQTGERAAEQTRGRSAGQTGSRAAGQTRGRSAGQTGSRSAGQTGSRAAGQTGSRSAGQTGGRTAGQKYRTRETGNAERPVRVKRPEKPAERPIETKERPAAEKPELSLTQKIRLSEIPVAKRDEAKPRKRAVGVRTGALAAKREAEARKRAAEEAAEKRAAEEAAEAQAATPAAESVAEEAQAATPAAESVAEEAQADVSTTAAAVETPAAVPASTLPETEVGTAPAAESETEASAEKSDAETAEQSPTEPTAEPVAEEAQADVSTTAAAVETPAAAPTSTLPETEVGTAPAAEPAAEEVQAAEASAEKSDAEAAVQSAETPAAAGDSEAAPATDKTSDAEKDGKKKQRLNRYHQILIFLLTILLIIVLIVVLFVLPSKRKGAKDDNFMDQIRTQEIKENDVAALDAFFNLYYTALASGNTTELEAMYDVPSKANITTEISTIVNKYDNIKVYVTQGIEDDDIVAFVSNDIHFANIEATAPSVDSFYLTYDPAEAVLRIRTDMFTDPDILKYMNLVSYRDPIRTILADTNVQLSQKLSENKDLNNLYILMQTMMTSGAEELTDESPDAKETTKASNGTEKETTPAANETETTEG